MEEVINDPAAEDGDGVEGDNETPVTEPEATPAEEPAATPEEEAVEIPEETPEVISEEDSEEAPAETTVENEINAVKPSAAVIKELEPGEGDAAKTLVNAEISYLYGCVDSEKKLATGKALSFRVTPKKGYKLATTDPVKVCLTGTTTPALQMATSGSGLNTIYTVAWDAIKAPEGDNVGRPIDIIVKTDAQTYGVEFTGNNFKVRPVNPKAENDSTKVLGGELTDNKDANLALDATKQYVIEAASGYKLVSVKIDGTALEPADVDIEKTVDSEPTTEKVKAYSVKPDTYVKAGDEKVTVKVETREEGTLTIDTDSEISANAKIEASTKNIDAEKFINYNATSKFETISEGDEKLSGAKAKSLAFKVTAKDANHKVTSVTAKVAPTDAEDVTEGTTVEVAPTTVAADGEYTIALDQTGLNDFDKDVTLTIFVTTDYDSTSKHIHTVTFAGDLDKVELTAGAGDELENGSVTATTTDSNGNYAIKVKAKDGYDLAKGKADGANANATVVTIKETRKYKDTEGKYTIDGTDNGKEIEFLITDDTEANLTLIAEDQGYNGATADTEYTVTSVTVTIKTVCEENTAEKQLYVDAKEIEYKVQYAEKDSTTFTDAELDETVSEETEGADPDNTWYIPKKAERVKVIVDSEKTLNVTLDTKELDKEAGDGNNYIFPAAILTADAGKISTLKIGEVSEEDVEEYATVTVKADSNDVELTAYEVGDDAEDTDWTAAEEADSYTLTNATVGKSLSLTFRQKDGATLKGVSYTMGETTGEVKATSSYGEVTAKLEIKEVTGNVTVVVDSESAYVVKLYSSYIEANEENGIEENIKELAKDKDGVYEADYMASGIQIRLYKTEDEKNGVPFYDVVVEEGNATAETGATVTGDFAILDDIHKSERGKVLTIKVYKEGEATPFVAKLRTNATSSAVKVTVGGKAVAKDSTVPMLLDASKTFKVESVGASTSDLGVKLFKKDGTALTATEQAWFTNSGNITLEADGTFTITTTAGSDKRDEVEVRIYNKNEIPAAGQTEAALEGGSFKLNVEGYMVNNDVKDVTATPGTASNDTVRINLNTNFKDKKNLPAKPGTGKLYYKVVLDEISGEVPAGVTKLTGAAALTKYYLLDDYTNPAQTVAIKLITGDTRDVKDDIDVVLSTTIKEVSLVQSVTNKDLSDETQTVADTDYVSGPAANIKDKDKTLATKAPYYETKLTVKAVNGATVFTGQKNVKVATPVFGKDTGYDSLSVQFVDTKTGVVYSEEGTESSYSSIFKAWVDPTDNSIYVSSLYGSTTASSYKTLGVKVIAAYPSVAQTNGEVWEGYAATAVVKLNIKQGIYSITADENKATLPKTIYVNGKNASVKITPKYNGGSAAYKPAKAAVTWEIAETSNENIQKNLNAVNSKGKAAPTISVKNGTVTVSKDYQFGKTIEDNTFTVIARANDFVGNKTTSQNNFKFTITDQQDKLEAGSIVIVDETGQVYNASALKAEEFDQNLYVAALKNDVPKNKTSYSAQNDFMQVNITSGSKANLEVTRDSYNRYRLTFKKPGTKLKINVNTVDGGKASNGVKVKDSLLVNIAAYENVGLVLQAADVATPYQPDRTEAIKYAGGSNQMYDLYLAHKHTVGSYADTWQKDGNYKNVKVTVKGGKLVSNKDWAKGSSSNVGTAVVVTDKSGKATITVTDTASKKATNYTIENTSFNAASQKAPSIKLYSPKKITADSLADADYTITYQVTDNTKDNYAGQYVKVTPDYTAANNMAKNLASYGEIGFAKIDENGRFDIYVGSYLNSGSYKMVATVGEMKRGEFLPLAKDVKLSFSIPKAKAANTSLTVKNSYTLDAKGMSYAKIDVKTGAPYYDISEAKNVIKKVQGKNDHTNRFTEFFEVVEWYYEGDEDYYTYYTIGLKSGLSAEQIEHITSKDGKNDCTGYITVTNYDRNDNALNTKDIQLKISFKANKYSLTGASIFTNGTATTPVTASVKLMNGKNQEAPALVWIDKTDDGDFIGTGNDAITFNRETGEIILKSKAAAIEPKKYNVKLIVVPQTSSYVKWEGNAETGRWIYANDKVGADGKALSNEEMAAKAGIPVTATIDVKALDAKKVIKIENKNLNVTLNADNYVESETANAMGNYVAYVPYDFVAGNTDIAAAAGSVKLAKDKNNKDLNEIAGETLPLITVDAKVTSGSEIETITHNGKRCIRITVSKAALQKQYEKTEANKKAAAKDKVPVVTTYGAKLKVPVEITYTNNGTTTEIVNFNVTMPKKPLTFDELKDILNGTTEIGTGKAKRNVKTEIEKIKTLQRYNSKDILNSLLTKVWDKVSSEIPKDADVDLTTATGQDGYSDAKKADLNDGTKAADDNDTTTGAEYDEIMNAGTAKVNMILTNKLATGDGAKVKLSYNFDAAALGVKHTQTAVGDNVAEVVKGEIQKYLNSLNTTDDLKVTNDLTEEKLLADIWALDGVKEYNSDRDSVNIRVEIFDRVPATEKKAGTLTVEVYVNNEAPASKTYTIARINNFGDVEDVLDVALAANNVKKIVDDCSGIGEKIKAKIVADAKKAIGNDNLTVAYAERVKAGSNPEVKEPVFDYEEPATSDEDGSIEFTLLITSKAGRTKEYPFTQTTIAKENASKYFDTAEKAVAAVKAAVVTSDPEDATKLYDKLKAVLEDVDNTEKAVKEKVEEALAEDKLKTVITGWTAKNITVTYKLAEPDDANDVKHPGEVTISADIVLTGDPTMTAKLTVTNAPVVPWKDSFTTVEQLKAKIQANTAIVVETALPASEAVAQGEIAKKINSLANGTKYTLEAVYNDETTPAALSADKTKYENVKIVIKETAGAKEVDTCTVTFNFSAGTTPGES